MHAHPLKKYEVPRAWAFVAPFTAANNQLTPKMSIRRKIVLQDYGGVVARLYGEEPPSSKDGDGDRRAAA